MADHVTFPAQRPGIAQSWLDLAGRVLVWIILGPVVALCAVFMVAFGWLWVRDSSEAVKSGAVLVGPDAARRIDVQA